MHIRHWALPFVALAAVALMAAAPPSTAPNYSPGVSLQPSAIYDAAGNVISNFGGTTTTSGALQPPTAATGKIVATSVALSPTTSTQLVAANANRIALEIQCDGTAAVGISRTGATLTSVAASPLVIPTGSYPLYTMPVATLTAVTAYTGTAQTCRVTEYNR